MLSLIDIVDINGKIHDLRHAVQGLGLDTSITTKHIIAPDYVVLSCGVARTAKIESELYLYKKNKPIVFNAMKEQRFKKNTRLIVCTNPAYRIGLYCRNIFRANPNYIEGELKSYRYFSGIPKHILRSKGYTDYAPAVAVCNKIKRMMNDS